MAVHAGLMQSWSHQNGEKKKFRFQEKLTPFSVFALRHHACVIIRFNPLKWLKFGYIFIICFIHLSGKKMRGRKIPSRKEFPRHKCCLNNVTRLTDCQLEFVR